MAALTRHAPLLLTSGFAASRTIDRLLLKSSITATVRRETSVRHKSSARNAEAVQTLKATREALAAKGFLRPQKEYVPRNDVSHRLDAICKSEGISPANDSRFADPVSRFKLLAACSKEFGHCVPNSLLHTVETVGDLREFYKTPVNTTLPLDTMRNVDLPENLHIQYEYHRFHPDTDTMFGGKSAFPKSSTLVTGLKYKKKYPGHIAKTSWP